MTLTGIIQDYKGLYACRIFLGLTETGFFPAASYLLTTWYVRFELQTRMAIFFSAGAFGGAFSGLLAAAIENMDGVGGLQGWRWIFILEGIFTVCVGATLPWTLPDSPASATFLTPDEKAFIHERLVRDSGSRHEPFRWTYVKNAFLEWRIYVAVIVYSGNSIALYAFIYAAPSIIYEMGYTSIQAQLLTAPVYIVGMISCIFFAVLSDRFRNRWLFIVIPYSMAMIGFLGCLLVPHPRLPGLTYGLLFFIPAGVYPPLMGTVAWVANNVAPSWKRAISMAILMTIGNFGGAIAGTLFLQKEFPRYWLGYGFCTGNVVVAILAACFLRWSWGSLNAARDKLSEDEIRAMYSQEELDAMGDKSPLYRYAL
jgi:MFS family permease